MPRHCSAGGCKSRDSRETRKAGLTFHKLPKGESRRKLWITNSHRAESWHPQTDFVYFCSKHFTPESFELTGCSGIRRLKEDAFPTVFDSSSTTKCKRKGTLKTEEDIPLRTDFHSCDQENPQQTDRGRPSEEASDQRSVPAAEETNENRPTSSQEPSGLEQLSKPECSPSPPPVPRPLSPSHYMRRLPPPPGFYLSKEHSYAQLCPLLWRRRYNEAIDSLEKALQQLHAARRRENRLRSTVLRLRNKRLKQVLLGSKDGCKSRGSLTPGGNKRQGQGGCNHEESETGVKSEDAGVFEDTHVDQMELGGQFLSDTSSWSEEEKGYCFYCGRGQVQVGGQVACRGPKTGKDAHSLVHGDSLKIQRGSETGTCSTAENAKDIQVVSPERLPGKSLESSDSDEISTKVLLQTQSPQHVIPAGVSLMDTHEQSLQFLGPQQKLLLSDMCDRGTETVSEEHQPNLQQQQRYWIQDSPEGQIILVPLPQEDELQSILKMDGVTDEAQIILVSDVDLKGEMGHMMESSRGLSGVETASDGEDGPQHPVINAALVETKEDMREKLKEHLEGFHLQLSTEFLI